MQPRRPKTTRQPKPIRGNRIGGDVSRPSVILPCACLPRGDGSFVVTPGKPVVRLTPDQFAAVIGVSPMSARRWIHDGTIPQEYVTARGKARWWISAAAVEVVRSSLNQRKLEA